jgi:hypothetical protein
MEPALGRRLFRLAMTVEVGLVTLAVVAVWGDPAVVLDFFAFVAITWVALLAYLAAARGSEDRSGGAADR